MARHGDARTGCNAASALHFDAAAGAPPDANGAAAAMDTEALLTRIKSEFNESPGMCLTLRQGSRLWGIAPDECAKLVERLVREDFLRWTQNGEVIRSESGGYRGRSGIELR